MAGREFTDADGLKAQKVAIVNQEFVKKFNLGSDAVGKMMGTEGRGGKLDVRIIGVVQNAKYSQVKDVVPPQFFQPYRQDEHLGSGAVYVRTAGDACATRVDDHRRRQVARSEPADGRSENNAPAGS